MGAHHPIDANVTWAMDFQFDATGDGKVLKLLNIIDEYSEGVPGNARGSPKELSQLQMGSWQNVEPRYRSEWTIVYSR
jgi:hypothetical protein